MRGVETGMRGGTWKYPNRRVVPCTPQASCFSEPSPDIPSALCRANYSLSTFTSPWAVPSSTSASWLYNMPGLSSHSGKPARYAGLGSTALWSFVPRTPLRTHGHTFVRIKNKNKKQATAPSWWALSWALDTLEQCAACTTIPSSPVYPPVSLCWLLLPLFPLARPAAKLW